MRKLFNFFAAALIMLAAVSCEKNETLPDNNSEGKIVTLKASINNGGTKTSLGPGVQEGSNPIQYPVYWSENDAIAVIQGEGEETKIFKFVLQGPGKTAEGEFQLEVYDGCDYTLEENAFNASAEIHAFYPFEGISLNNDGSINYTVPATQTYTTTVVNEVVCSTFGNGVSPMAAYAGNAADGLSFENLFGVLKLQLKGVENEKVFGIEIISDNTLKGNAQLTIDDASNSISLTLTGTESSDKKVILKCKEGVSLSPGTPTDFLVTLPANATNLKVLIHTKVGSYTKDIPVSNTNKIVAGQILLMPELILGTSVAPIIYKEKNGEVYKELGNGIAIPNSDGTFTIWAPVNCGYEPANESYKGYPYGKLYQWGRKDGQGYYYINNGVEYANNDAGVGPSITPGTISWEDYVAGNYSNVFFKVTRDNPSDWLSAPKSDLWGNGTKTIHDPCPDGWRVPTIAELEALALNYRYDYNKGYWFSGENTCDVNYPRIFLQFAGYHKFDLEVGSSRGEAGYYWSSTADDDYSKPFVFSKSISSSAIYINCKRTARASGHSVRCVKDMTQSQPIPGSN